MPPLLRAAHRYPLKLLLTLLLIACDSSTGPGRLEVTVSPSGLVSLSVGDTLTVSATIVRGRAGTVRFASSNGAVVSINEVTGKLEAKAPGEATITAAPLERPQAAATLQVRVADRPATVIIDQIVDAAGSLILPNRVVGTVNVQLTVELGSARNLEVLIDTVVACGQSFESNPAGSAARSTAPITCPVRTADFVAATGVVRHKNGPAVVSARLLAADGRTVAQTTGVTITLANANTFVTEIIAPRQATAEDGLRWVDGSLVANLVPVIYDREVSLGRAVFTYTSPIGRTLTRMDVTEPFSVVFEEDSLENLQDPALRLAISTSTAAGDDGPGGMTTPFRYDNRKPNSGTILSRAWVGSETRFVDTFRSTPDIDGGGVGRVAPTFFSGDPILSDTALTSRGRQVSRGADLTPRPADGYKVAVLVCDALLNCLTREGFRFGVDLNPPTIESVNLPERSINPAGYLGIGVVDDLSGFDGRPVEATVRAQQGGVVGTSCGPVVGAVDLPGKTIASVCRPDTLGTLVPIPTATAGYYTYDLTVFDRAGNRSTATNRVILIDHQAPELASVTLPAQLQPGEFGSFSASATDNLDLSEIVFRLTYPGSSISGSIALSFDTASASVGTPFSGTLSRQSARTSRFPMVRTLTYASPNGRSTVLVDSMQVVAADAAHGTSATSRLVSGSMYGNNASIADPFMTGERTVTGIAALRSDDQRAVCSDRCASGDRTNARLEFTISGSSALIQPFARVYFYSRKPGARATTLIGSVSGLNAEGVVGSGQATYTYAFTYTPPTALTGALELFAVGVSSSGNALRNEPIRVDFFTR